MQRFRKIAAVIAVLVIISMVGVFSINHFMTTPQAADGSELDPLPEPDKLAGDPAADPSFAKFYDQEPVWEPCYTATECATITVPLDWGNPEGDTMQIALSRSGATGTKQGSLLYNPGGPGASGRDMVGHYAQYLATPQVRSEYDLVGYDPRGVGASQPIDCLGDAELEEYLFEDLDPETEEGWDKSLEAAEEFVEGCEENMGPAMEFVDTLSAARDMDLVRAALGDERLNYLGVSYGTLLGATYANEFPTRVGRMVLDGALDPAAEADDVMLGQAKGMQSALEAFLADCLGAAGCPFDGSVDDAVQQIAQWLNTVDDEPLPTGDDERPLTAPRAVIGIVTPLYSQDQWPMLRNAFDQAINQNNGAIFLQLSDQYTDRDASGAYGSNIMEAFTVIECADSAQPESRDDSLESAKKAEEVSPVFGAFMSNGATACAKWPYEGRFPSGEMHAEGAPPILVVGTTNDPATPYDWAVRLAEQLESGRLLTFEGEGHTAYAKASRCINDTVDAYLLGESLPDEGATCT